MARLTNKKEPTWITAKEAAIILDTDDRYIRRLAARGEIETWKITPRQSMYSKEDTERYPMKKRRPKKEKQRKAKETDAA